MLTTPLVPAINTLDHASGQANAVIELVEYGDYQCPYCGRAYPIVKNIQDKLGKDLLFVFRNFPLSKIHPQAFSAAVATEAAARQNKFWEMHDIVFENQHALDRDNLLNLADTIGLDVDQLEQDMLLPALTDKVRNDFESGIRSGVNRTPTFFINGKKYEGDWDEATLLQYLKGLITTASTTL